MYRSNQFASQHKGKAGQAVAPVSSFRQSGYNSDLSKPFQSSLASLKQTLPPPLPEQRPVVEQERHPLPNTVQTGLVESPPPLKDEAMLKDETMPLTSSIKDEQIGGLFLAMGRASQLSTFQLAQRLQTSTDIILALEAGAIDLLPEWEELSQVVSAYTNFMNVDERPILRRLREKLTEHYLTSMSQDHPDFHDKGTPLLPMSDASLQKLATTGPQPVSHLAQNKDNLHKLPPSFSGDHEFSKPQAPYKAPPANQQGVRHQMPVGHFPPAHHVPSTPMRHEVQPISVHEPHYTQPKQTKRWYKNWTKIAANIAFVVILLAGFIHWQPNRFWSGVDQLPKPIANSIYSIFELVMPDPLASTYRMNWVHVDDPRMRKADRLIVPKVKKLPKIDFSNLGTLTTR